MSELVEYRQLKSRNPLLGRNIEKDARSLAYRPQLLGEADLEGVRHHINIEVLGQIVGSCTCNNQINMIASDQIWETLSQGQKQPIEDAPNAAVLDWYRQVTREDEFSLAWEPDDTGSSGTSASKVTVKRGYAKGFINGYTVPEARAMNRQGTFGIGTWWYSSFNRPASDGRVSITAGAYKEGGHQYTNVEYDSENDRWVYLNSWTEDFGLYGEFWYDSATLARLLAEDGDLVQLIPNTQSDPEPDWDLMLAAPLRTAAHRRIPYVTRAERAAFREWLIRKGL